MADLSCDPRSKRRPSPPCEDFLSTARLVLVQTDQRKVSNACSACQARKSKCSGGDPPCVRCLHHGTECQYLEWTDRRRKAALKRKQEAVEADRELLYQLIETLRTSDTSLVTQLIALIRSGALISEIRLCIDEHVNQHTRLGHKQTPEFQQVRSELKRLSEFDDIPRPRASAKPRPVHRRRVLDVAQLADVPTHQVPAGPWTTIAEDAIVSHLVSLFFAWYTPLNHLIQRDLFLREMRAGDLSSPYCSPFLVNSILAASCPLSDFAETKSSRGAVSVMADNFVNEAKRYFDEEAGRNSLATVQGLTILAWAVGLGGKDRHAMRYLQQVAIMTEEIVRDSGRTVVAGTETAREYISVTNHSICSMFSVLTASAIAYQIPPLMNLPPNLRPRISSDRCDKWYPYPIQAAPIPWYLEQFDKAFYEMNVINARVGVNLFATPPQGGSSVINHAQLTFRLHEQYCLWFKELPDCLRVNRQPTPEVLTLHMCYHSLSIKLLAWMRTSDDQLPVDIMERAGHICHNAAINISSLMDLHSDLFGTERMSPMNMQYITLALHVLMDELNPDNTDLFIRLCGYLRACARRWPFWLSIVRTLQVAVAQKQVALPPETAQLFQDFESKEWKARERVPISSCFPEFGATVRKRTGVPGPDESCELEHVLRQWEDLDISGGSSLDNTR